MRMSIRQLHETAYRKRMGMVGVLSVCICAFPVVKEETGTEHSKHCPAHQMILAQRELAAGESSIVIDEAIAEASSFEVERLSNLVGKRRKARTAP